VIKSSSFIGHCCLWLVVAAAVLAAGCGSESGSGEYHVSGSVTFDGRPVPAGKIIFTPDAAAKNSGPQGFADIRDGRFDTSAGGQGVVGGPHEVEIQGFDSTPAPDSPPPKPLFNAYTTKTDLPRENAQQDYAVPASAAAGLVISAEPPP
jgi:hypothetical protein